MKRLAMKAVSCGGAVTLTVQRWIIRVLAGRHRASVAAAGEPDAVSERATIMPTTCSEVRPSDMMKRSETISRWYGGAITSFMAGVGLRVGAAERSTTEPGVVFSGRRYWTAIS